VLWERTTMLAATPSTRGAKERLEIKLRNILNEDLAHSMRMSTQTFLREHSCMREEKPPATVYSQPLAPQEVEPNLTCIHRLDHEEIYRVRKPISRAYKKAVR
jgi:hypothetical protein